MKGLLALSAFYPFLTAASLTHVDINPIYIGHVFLPPSLHFLAWKPLSTSNSTSLSEYSTTSSPEWCHNAVEISESASFSLPDSQEPGTDTDLAGLEFHNYFKDEAYLTRNGKRWGSCYVTPESVDLGWCEKGDRWARKGVGTRTWTCWGGVEHVVEEHVVGRDEAQAEAEAEAEAKTDGIGSGSGFTGTVKRAKETTKASVAGSEAKTAFTAVMTGI